MLILWTLFSIFFFPSFYRNHTLRQSFSDKTGYQFKKKHYNCSLPAQVGKSPLQLLSVWQVKLLAPLSVNPGLHVKVMASPMALVPDMTPLSKVGVGQPETVEDI